MRVIFMGTPEFAVTSLEVLIRNKINVVAVVTAPDKPAGRGKNITESAVKKFSKENNLPVLQPLNLKSETFINELQSFNADLQIVVAFRMLPETVWNMPRLGTYNLHASLLPAYRGAAPINWVLINGEKETGITTFKLVHEIDAGNILFSKKLNIEEQDNAGSLHGKLKTLGAELILKTVLEIISADEKRTELVFIPQDKSKISHAPKLTRENCRIDWNKSVENIHNLIRGLSPYPAAYTDFYRDGKVVSEWKILNSRSFPKEHSETNGSLFTEGDRLFIYCKKGTLEILELQQQGKKRMVTSDFIKGFRLQKGDHLK